MTADVAEKTQTAVARPLKVLVPLIQEDLKHGDEAADRASEPYYRAAGEKLIEAKAQMPRGSFMPWISKNFHRSQSQAIRYMRLARTTEDIQNERQRPSRFHLSKATGDKRQTHQNKWHEPIKDIADRARRDAERIRDEQLNRAQEREELRKLCLRIIDIGFKVLSKELHPDKGGSREAMARLNRARDHLKASA